ncbi:hypothetical protein [Enterobacter pseudoroggenkampii]|uniref:hypothetical protein n=1 Tax=Enterobacter pseudoroggenkampii TaxID=2996112 RepID=UPI0038B18CAD
MKLTLKEMNGLLNGKCLPSDLIVGETLAEYLVRKFADLEQQLAESQREFRAADATIENLQMELNAEREAKLALAAEAQGFKRFFLFAINAAFDGCNITGDQIQELAKEIGLVRVEIYSAEKHAEMSGDPSVMEEGDDFYIMNKTPATDTFLAEVRVQAKADGVQEYADSFRHSASKIRECHGDTIRVRALLHEANNADEFAAQLRKGVQS